MQRWELEARARAESGAPGRQGQPFPFVTISRDHGSGGQVIAEKLAERLGWTCLNRQVVDYVAAHTQVRAQLIELLDEHTRGHLETWIRSHVMGKYLNETDYARHLASVIRAVICQDPAVILGRGGAYMLAGERQYGLHVRVVAPFEYRVLRIAETQSLSKEEARARILSVDHDREEFLRSVFHRNGKDPLDYDLLINTAYIGLDDSVSLLLRALEARRIVAPRSLARLRRTPITVAK
jgi:cytidylate kinase